MTTMCSLGSMFLKAFEDHGLAPIVRPGREA